MYICYMVTLNEIKTNFCRMIKRDKRSLIYNKKEKKDFLEYFAHIVEYTYSYM